jgi:zinc transporter ZupT
LGKAAITKDSSVVTNRTFKPMLPFGLGLAAGAMIWMVFAELLPDATKKLEPASVGVVIVLAFLGMMAFQVAIR